MTNTKIVQRDTGVVQRQFKYSLDGVNLDFTLRIDVKKELKDFLELLKIAEQDVSEELNKISDKS